MGTESNDEKSGAEYLAQLLKDKKQIQAFPNVFIHLERILDDEINKVRVTLFNLEKKPLALPDEEGPKITLTEKLFVPVKEHPDFNFVGRILGPRGITAKQLERDTGCKIMVRGKGSMRDKKKEEQMKGKPNWEHLNEELHVLVVVEDSQHRAEIKMKRAVDEIKRLLVPAPEGEDDLKKIQLMELAIMNGTYRDQTKLLAAAAQSAQMQHRLMGQPIIPTNAAAYQHQFNLAAMQQQQQQQQQNLLRAQQLGGQLMLSPRLQTPGAPSVQTSHQQALMGMPPMVSSADAASAQSVLYSAASLQNPGMLQTTPGQTDLGQYGLVNQTLLDYNHAAVDPSAAGAMPKVRRPAVATHPYQRV